jgi:hypothetical protein
MKISNWTWLVVLACLVSWSGMAARPGTGWQLAVIVSCSVALATLATLIVRGAWKWRERGIVNLVSCLLIVAAPEAGIVIGRTVRGALLSHDLERYRAAAQWVSAHYKPNTLSVIHLPPRYGDLAYGVHYERDDVCGTTIDFYWGGAFPVKHVVRRFAANPDWLRVDKCHKDWGLVRPISGNWYEITD